MNTLTLDLRTRTDPPGKIGGISDSLQTRAQAERYRLEGFWRSQGGSLYVFEGNALVCISVHSAAFRGWIGKVAIRDICRVEGGWRGWQAFRNKLSGELTDWHPVTLSFANDKLTKYFPAGLSAQILVYGHVEHYYRVEVH